MNPNLTWQVITLNLINPFRLSYGSSDERTAHWIRLRGDEGWGEGTIPPYYHTASEAMIQLWQKASCKSEPFPNDLEAISVWVGADGPAPARCALDLALHDRLAKRIGVPIYKLLELPFPASKPSSFTISIDTPEAMARIATKVNSYPILKVKLGGDEMDMERLAAIRTARPDALLRIDANAGWSFGEALRNIPLLEKLDLEMIEQPLAKSEIEAMGKLQAQTTIPIVADESVQTLADIDALAKAGVKGVNIKLMKTGGLAPGLGLIRRARELGMQVMLGCMIETSVGVTSMAHLSGLADWLDLDASLLIANDPFEGMTLDGEAKVSIPDRPGIGVRLKNQG